LDVLLDSPSSTDTVLADKNIRILLNVLRPAHTLYKLRFVLQDEYTGQKDETKDQLNKITDSFNFILSSYGYEDLRKFTEGVEGIDTLGIKKTTLVSGEDHSNDW
jgi:hypothetical protein